MFSNVGLFCFFFCLICLCNLEYCQYDSEVLLCNVFSYSWDYAGFTVTEIQILLVATQRSHSCFAAFDEWNRPRLMQWLVSFKVWEMRTILEEPLTETGKVILYLNDDSTTKWLSGNLGECEFSKEPHPSRTNSDSVESELKNPFRHF